MAATLALHTERMNWRAVKTLSQEESKNIRNLMSEEEIKTFHEAFHEFDHNDDGHINTSVSCVGCGEYATQPDSTELKTKVGMTM